jgi:hypothetical protein
MPYQYDGPRLKKHVNVRRIHNLSQDIGEKDDLAKQYPEKLKALEAEYAAWNSHNVEPRWKPAPRAGAVAKASSKG